MQTFQDGEELFGLPKTEYPELQQTQHDLHLLSQLYTLYTSCTKSVEGYLLLPVRKLNVTLPNVTKELEHFDERIQGLPKLLWKYPAYKEMKETVDNLTSILPLVRMLINPAMRPRHWQEVMVITQTVLEITSPTFSVKDLLDANLQKHQHSLHDICQAAQLELQTEEKLQEVSGEWERSALSFINFKNTGPIILDVNKTRLLAQSLDEFQVALHTLLNSQHSVPFREPINQLLAKFVSFLDLLDVWLHVQHTWWYVGVVFSGDDISTQLPQEAKRFRNVNTAYVALMQDAFTLRYVMMVHEQRDGMFHTLLELREQVNLSSECGRVAVCFSMPFSDSCVFWAVGNMSEVPHWVPGLEAGCVSAALLRVRHGPARVTFLEFGPERLAAAAAGPLRLRALVGCRQADRVGHGGAVAGRRIPRVPLRDQLRTSCRTDAR